MTASTYTTISVDDVSTGVATRQRVYLAVADPEHDVPAIREIVRQLREQRVDIGFVFVYRDASAAGQEMARVRARYISRGAKGAPTVPWVGSRQTEVSRECHYTLEIAWEREAAG